MSASERHAAWPAPPAHYKTYTDEAVATGEAAAPPAIPDAYTVFGMPSVPPTQLVQPLSSFDIKETYDSSAPRQDELLRLNHTVLNEFRALLKELTTADAASAIAKLNQITLLFTNIHHLLNEFRPHQAFETLRAMLEKQATDRVELTEQLRQTCAEVEVELKKVCEAVDTTTHATGTNA